MEGPVKSSIAGYVMLNGIYPYPGTAWLQPISESKNKILTLSHVIQIPAYNNGRRLGYWRLRSRRMISSGAYISITTRPMLLHQAVISHGFPWYIQNRSKHRRS
jgi:hypothetical protein